MTAIFTHKYAEIQVKCTLCIWTSIRNMKIPFDTNPKDLIGEIVKKTCPRCIANVKICKAKEVKNYDKKRKKR